MGELLGSPRWRHCKKPPITEIQSLVRQSRKGRSAMAADESGGWLIRATQGHSRTVDHNLLRSPTAHKLLAGEARCHGTRKYLLGSMLERVCLAGACKDRRTAGPSTLHPEARGKR